MSTPLHLKKIHLRTVSVFLLAGLTCFQAGCGKPKTGVVFGKITFRGNPLPGGKIISLANWMEAKFAKRGSSLRMAPIR
jgi:hypothetical protein